MKKLSHVIGMATMLLLPVMTLTQGFSTMSWSGFYARKVK